MSETPKSLSVIEWLRNHITTFGGELDPELKQQANNALEQIYVENNINQATRDAIELVVEMNHEEKLLAKGGLTALGVRVSHLNAQAEPWLQAAQEWANNTLDRLFGKH